MSEPYSGEGSLKRALPHVWSTLWIIMYYERLKVALSGQLDRFRMAVTLEVEPDVEAVVAKYNQTGEQRCTPNLETQATFRLSATTAEQADVEVVTRGMLELRFGVLLSAATFQSEDNDALTGLAPEFSVPITGSPWLNVWLTDIDRERVDSQRRWTAPIDCTGRQLCSGYDELNLDAPMTRLLY